MARILVVLDSNVIISSLLKASSASSRIIELWRKEYFDLVSSNYIIDEIKKTLRDKELAHKYHLSPSKQSRLLTQLKHFSVLVEPVTRVAVGRDQKDYPVLSTALTSHAHYLVTGDLDLLILANNSSIGELAILNPHNFLREFISSDES